MASWGPFQNFSSRLKSSRYCAFLCEGTSAALPSSWEKKIIMFYWPRNSQGNFRHTSALLLRVSRCPPSSSRAVSAQHSWNSSLFVTSLISGDLFWNHCSFHLGLDWRTALARHLQERPYLNKSLRVEFMSFPPEFLFWGTKIKRQESYSQRCACNGGV